MAFTIPNEANTTFAPQAAPDSTDIAALTAGLNGTGVNSGCAVSAQSTPDMTVAVAAGTAQISGVSVAVATVASLAIGAASTTDRKDIVVVDNTGTVSLVAGTPSDGCVNGVTPAGSHDPVKSAIPANSVLLASVYVAASTASIAAGNITDKRAIVGGFNLKPRGAWSATTVYALNDAVTANGVAWRCILAHTSGSTFSADPTKWERFGVGQVLTSAPPSPATDDLWYDKANDQWKRWSGSAWIATGSNAYLSLAGGALSGRLREQAGSLFDTAPGSDVVNGVASYLLIEGNDTYPDANGITIKRSSHGASAWGLDSANYGTGQAIEVLDDSTTAVTHRVNVDGTVDTTNPSMFRVDLIGGMGLSNGIHCATGIRRQGDAAAPTQGIWIQPYVDAVGLVIDNPDPVNFLTTPTQSYLLCRDSRSTPVYTLLDLAADGTLKSNKAALLTGRTSSDYPLTVKEQTTGTGIQVQTTTGSKRVAISSTAVGLFGDDGTTLLANFNSGTGANGLGYRLLLQPGQAGVIPLFVKGIASQTADQILVWDSSNAVQFRINKNGHWASRKTAAPVLADLADGDHGTWLDTTNSRVTWYARIGGVLKTATVAVA